jgi:hypothetical protein
MILSENRSHANRQRRQPALLSTRPVTPPKVGIALIPTFPTGNILNHVAPVSVKGKRCSFTSPRDLAEAFHGTWLTAGARVQLGILDVLRDRLDEAKSLLDEALNLNLAARSIAFVAFNLAAYARLAFAGADPGRAALLAGAAEGLRRRAGLRACGPGRCYGAARPSWWPRSARRWAKRSSARYSRPGRGSTSKRR